MTRIYIKDLSQHIDKEVSIKARVEVRRDQGKLVFFDFADFGGIIQGVILPNQKTAHEIAKPIRQQWVVSVKGKINQRPEKNIQTDKQNGNIEMEIFEIEVLTPAAEMPFDLNADLNQDTLLDYRPLTIRREREQKIFKVQETILNAFREFLNSQNFTEFQAPKIVGDDAEGGTEVFSFDYFYGKRASLATSPQLYKQMMTGVYERVYTTGTQFRAEKHATTRHLNEIYMLDFEMGFINDHQDVIDMISNTLRHITQKVTEKHTDSLKFFGTTPSLAPDQFPQMKLREAQELIKKETGKDCIGEPDLEPEDERWLCEYAATNLASDFVVITHYPVSKRPFYTMEDKADLGMTKSFDILFRGVEILSGSQRIHDHDALVANMKLKGLDPEKFRFYLTAFKYGLAPHGGIGMGLERLTEKFLNLDSIKEATLFPRDINRIDLLLSQSGESAQ